MLEKETKKKKACKLLLLKKADKVLQEIGLEERI